MNPNDPNVQLIEAVARQLGQLTSRLVLVGGCATSLLITDLARPPARATVDVDLIVETLSVAGYYQLQSELRERGLKEDPELACRWRLGQLVVDVMPTDERILGFTNRWYQRAAEQSERKLLPSGIALRVISAPLFLATKLEVFHGRGEGDYAASHDVEDIVAVVDGRPELIDEVARADEDVREYLEEEIDGLLGEIRFTSTLGYHLPGDGANQGRIPLILQRFRNIAGI